MLILLRKFIDFLNLKNKMNPYPLRTCHFQVDWGDARVSASEVSGLAIELETIEYRKGDSKSYTPELIPGKVKTNSIFLKRGIIQGNNDYFDWFKTAQLNAVERRDLTISLLNENHEPVVTWKLKNAFPIKMEWSDLKADANEAAIETIEIVHEGILVIND